MSVTGIVMYGNDNDNVSRCNLLMTWQSKWFRRMCYKSRGFKIGQKGDRVNEIKMTERMKSCQREWCWIHRKSGEIREVVWWTAVGGEESWSKWSVRRGYNKVKNVIFIVSWVVYMLTKVERSQKWQKLRRGVICRII